MTNKSASVQIKKYWLQATLIVSIVVTILLAASARHVFAAGPNLAAGKVATGSIAINSPAFITDAEKGGANYAGQEVGAQWIQIDLGQAYNLNQVNVWHYFSDGRTYHDVIVQVSNDATFATKTTVFNNDTNNSAGQGTGTAAEYAETSAGKTITFTTTSARYVRLWVNGSSANAYNHYVEVEVYADTGAAPTATRTNTPVGPTATRTNTPVTSGNLALNRPATASSVEAGTTFVAANAVDGNAATRWSSTDPATTAEWIYVDLGAASTISRVVLSWEAAYASGYQIQTSSDAVNWTSIYTTTTGDGAIDDVSVAGSGRYVRIYCSTRGSVYGYSLWAFEVYGSGGGPTATNTPVGPTVTRTNTSAAPTATRTRTPTATAPSTSHPASELFDDFSYTGPADSNLTNFGWTVRNDTDGPGPAGSGYKPSNITFITDPNNASNKLMRMAATTNGTAGTGTSQAQIDWNAYKFLEGTYATRFYMTDAPVSGGPDGDEINETFFTITPLAFSMDPAYSENDFEYLANGGWGIPNSPTMWNTTWETYQPDPWIKDGVSTSTIGSLAGWHDLLMTVSGGQANGHVKYYVDGVLIADHSGKYYPETAMSIDYNIWYIPETLGAAGTGTTRTYIQQADWMYFTPNTVLTQAQVNALVADFRAQALVRKNTVP